MIKPFFHYLACFMSNSSFSTFYPFRWRKVKKKVFTVRSSCFTTIILFFLFFQLIAAWNMAVANAASPFLWCKCNDDEQNGGGGGSGVFRRISGESGKRKVSAPFCVICCSGSGQLKERKQRTIVIIKTSLAIQ